MDPQRAGPSSGPTVALTLLAVVGGVWLLRTADDFFVPVTIAVATVAVIRPAHRWLLRALPPALRMLAHLLAAAIPILVVGLLVGVIGFALSRLATSEQFQLSALQDLVDQARTWAESRGLSLPGTGGDLATRAAEALATTTLTIVGAALVVVFLLLLLLDEIGTFEGLVDRAFGDDTAARLHALAEDWASSLRGFLIARSIAGFVAGALGLGWMLINGVELAWVWAVQTFILNYVPKLGSIVGGVPPVLLTLIQHGPARAALLAGGLILIEQVAGNWLDPKLQGGKLGLSSFFVLSSVVFFGWLWGVAGAFLAIPMLTLIVTVMDRFDLAPPLLAFLRGGRRTDAATASP
jgi:AI-2 transport protein TqsA